MQRYSAFILGAFLIIGSGCYKATGPIDSTQNDSTMNLVSLGPHYPYMTVSFSNVIIIGYHYSANDNFTIYDFHDTTLKSSSFSTTYVPWNAELKVDSALILRTKNQIPKLNGGIYLGSSVQANFANLTFKNYEPDSSIHISLSGIDAGKNIVSMSNYHHDSYLHWGGQHGTYTEYETENLDYYKCTDSTRIEIVLPYIK